MSAIIPEFNVMRALGIFIILAHHLPDYCFNYYNLNYLGINIDISLLNDLNRYFALGIFIFISGYLLNEKTGDLVGWRNITNFIFHRYVRIYPLYLLAFLIFVITLPFLTGPVNLFSFIVHLLGLQILLASKYCETILTLWFISLILVYYYVFVVINKYGKTNYRLLIIGVIIPLIFISLKYFMGIGDVRVILYLPIFLGGILNSRKGLLNRFKNNYLIFYILILLLLIYVYAIYLYPRYFYTAHKPSLISTINIITFVILNMIMFLFVIIVKHVSIILKNWKYYTILNSLSYASYSIFLFHRPIWWLLLKIYNPMNGYVRGGFLVIIGIPVTIVTSYYIQKTYDYYIAGRVKIN